MSAMLTREEFLDHLREALNHLNDPDRLCRSPLAALFGVAGRLDTYAAMQDILVGAIEALRPGPGVPADARAWRVFDLLNCRYVQELTVPQVAHQLGVSERQLHREQRAALDALARILLERFGLEGGGEVTPPLQEVPPAPQAASALNLELAWLRTGHGETPTDLGQATEAVLDLVRPLASRYGVKLHVALPASLPGLAVHPVGLQQILLHLVNVAIHRAPGGEVHLAARSLGSGVELEVRTGDVPVPAATPLTPEDRVALETARQLAELCRVEISLPEGAAAFVARAVLPAHQPVIVLAVDDNPDTLRLLEHYTVGTRYRLIGTSDPYQALELAQAHGAGVIVLDVMMPQMDGWRLLGRLREHPATRHVPVMVCTIVAQEELALSLGAAACIRKPVTQGAFLAALDQQVALLEPESR